MHMNLLSRMIPTLAAAAAITLSACGGDTRSTVDTASAMVARGDTALSPIIRDSAAAIEVVPPSQTTAEPQPVTVPETTAPATTRPKAATPRPARAPAPRAPAGTPPAAAPAPVVTPAPAEPETRSGVVASGTTFRVTSGAKVCTNTLQVGERVTTTLASVVPATNGVAIPAGARVALVVTKSKNSGAQNDPAELAFDVRSLSYGGENYTVQGDVSTDAILMERKGGDAKKVAIGAAAGAVIGNVIGGGSRAQRTVVGAAAGGLAGAAAAAVTGDRFACLPEGSTLTVHLGAGLTVRN